MGRSKKELAYLISMYPQYDADILTSIYHSCQNLDACVNQLHRLEQEYDVTLMTQKRQHHQKTSKPMVGEAPMVAIDDIKISWTQKISNMLPKVNRKHRYKSLKDDV
tara:strand:+ start:488 stop:808 length:321 start_codon:yes stop_codon:yes gene_type:complete